MNYLNYNKLKFKSEIFKSPIKSIVYKFFIILFSKNLSAKYHQENKEQLQKKARERYQNLPKEEKKKSNNMVVKVTKIFQKMKNISLFSIEKTL